MGPEGITGGSAIGDGWRDSRIVDGIWPVVSTGSTTRPPGARRVRGLDGLDHPGPRWGAACPWSRQARPPGADGNSGFVRDHATMLDSTRVRIQVPIVAISDACVALGRKDSPMVGSARATGRPAAFFDLDKTIIAKSSTLAFSKPFQAGGLISRRAVLRSAYAQFVYLVGGADHDQMEKMRRFLSDLCAGWDVQTVRDIVADTLHNIVDPLVYDEAVTLIEEHHLAGRDVII